MRRDHRQYLDDILQSIERIRRYVAGMDRATFEADEKTVDAVVRNLEVIGEAARNLPDAVRARTGDIEWPKIIALRNLLAHEYFGINTRIVWDIVQNKLAPLREACVRALEEGEAGE